MQIIIENLEGSGQLWLDIMRIICGDTAKQNMIDLGCHKAPYTSQLGFAFRQYVDTQDRALDNLEEQQYFIKYDAIHYLNMCDEYFDVTIASDFIEHLTKDKGEKLLDSMWKCSDKQIIFTPLGDASVTTDGHPDSHASGWLPEDFPEWLTVSLPNFHSAINLGAFFAVNCEDEEKQRIYTEIKQKYVREDQTN